jgi:predicted ATP-binding protein involved in virulence
MRKALPDVQIIASSHSPFVISSCPGSRVHVLQVDERGRAHARPPVDAPFGQSVTATLKDIFEVRSRFDIQTERDLDTWNVLKRKEASGALRPAEKKRLERLTRDLSERNEELRLLVNSPPKLSRRLVESLVVGETGASKRSRRPPQRIAG